MPIRTIKDNPNQNLEKVKERFQEALEDGGKDFDDEGLERELEKLEKDETDSHEYSND